MERVGLGVFVILGALFVLVASASSQVMDVEGAVSGSAADFSGGTVVQGENKIVHSSGAVVLESTNHVAAADRFGWFTFKFNATPKVNITAVDLVIVSSEDIQAEIDVWKNSSRTYNSTSCSQSGVVFANGTQANSTICINSSSTVVGFNWSLVKGTELVSGNKEVRFGPFSAQKDKPVEAQVRIRNFPRGNVYKFDFCLVPSGVNLSVAKQNGLGGCLDPSAQGLLKENLWLDFCGGNISDSSGNKLQFQLTGTLTYTNWSFGCAAEFNPDNGNDYLRNDTSLSTLLKYDLPNSYTILGWFYSDNNGVQNHFWEAGNSKMALTFLGTGDPGKIRVYHDPGTINTFSQAFPTGTWEFAAVVFNGTHVIVWRNVSSSSPVAYTAVQAYTAVTVGALFTQSAGYFDGKIANYRHYNFSLNSTEISLLFDGGNGTNQSLYDRVYGVASQNANEAQGDVAIEAGINSSLPSATRYSSQQVYIRNLSNNHTLGRFDWVASFGSQRWLINYITAGESYVNAPNLTTAVYVLEITSKTSAQITEEVSKFINATKS